MERHLHQGERPAVTERMIVAPAVGVFRPLLGDHHEEELVLDVGQPIGILSGPGTEVEVCSPFSGLLMRVLARPGERLQEGQPVAWLRIP